MWDQLGTFNCLRVVTQFGCRQTGETVLSRKGYWSISRLFGDFSLSIAAKKVSKWGVTINEETVHNATRSKGVSIENWQQKMSIRCQGSTGLYLLCELHCFCRPRRKASSITWKHGDEVRLSATLIVAIWSAIWVNCKLVLFSIWPIDAQKRLKCSGDEKSFQSLAMIDIFVDASVVIAGWVSFSEQ